MCQNCTIWGSALIQISCLTTQDVPEVGRGHIRFSHRQGEKALSFTSWQGLILSFPPGHLCYTNTGSGPGQ